MKQKLIALMVLLTTNFAVFAQTTRSLPTTKVRDINGKPVAFNKAFEEGKVTIVSFWATWCIPCKQEIKAINSKLTEWKKEADINYAAVSIDDMRDMAKVKTYSTTQKWNFPVYLDPNSDLKRSLNFSNVPFTIIIDKKGKIAHMHTGYEEGGENEIFEIAKKLAAE
jgi:cytochrome c biogenesis protein CcmG, thiol:disulfide interchange protein DsbE